MPRYLYKAKKGPTEIVQGEINAENEDAALGKIAAQGYIPVKLTPVSDSAPGETLSHGKKAKEPQAVPLQSDQKSKARISNRDLNIFTRQFAILMRASVPLMRIFKVLQTQTQNQKFKDILTEIQNSLSEGGSLSEVLSAYPRIFSHLYLNMIHAGEVSGTLDKVLMRLSEFAEKEAEIRSKVQSAIIYPIFLLLVGIATIFVLMTFVMPRLMVVFSDLGNELPAVTQVIIGISEFCQAHWIWMLGGVIVFVVWIRTIGLSAMQMKAIDLLMVRFPAMGSIVEKAEVAKFLRSLELLYEHGIPLYQAVEVSARTVSNSAIREALMEIPEHLEGGATLSASLEKIPYISSFVTNMISVGEESGHLGTAVRETASFYEQETNQVIKVATSLLEPTMILGIGLIVGFIVIAMLLPIFEIHDLAS